MSDRTPMRQLRRAARIPVLRMGLFGLAAALLLALPASGYGKSDASGSAKKDQLEVFSWWTGGGEAHGLAKLITIWNKSHPTVPFKNDDSSPIKKRARPLLGNVRFAVARK